MQVHVKKTHGHQARGSPILFSSGLTLGISVLFILSGLLHVSAKPKPGFSPPLIVIGVVVCGPDGTSYPNLDLCIAAGVSPCSPCAGNPSPDGSDPNLPSIPSNPGSSPDNNNNGNQSPSKASPPPPPPAAPQTPNMASPASPLPPPPTNVTSEAPPLSNDTTKAFPPPQRICQPTRSCGSDGKIYPDTCCNRDNPSITCSATNWTNCSPCPAAFTDAFTSQGQALAASACASSWGEDSACCSAIFALFFASTAINSVQSGNGPFTFFTAEEMLACQADLPERLRSRNSSLMGSSPFAACNLPPTLFTADSFACNGYEDSITRVGDASGLGPQTRGLPCSDIYTSTSTPAAPDDKCSTCQQAASKAAADLAAGSPTSSGCQNLVNLYLASVGSESQALAISQCLFKERQSVGPSPPSRNGSLLNVPPASTSPSKRDPSEDSGSGGSTGAAAVGGIVGGVIGGIGLVSILGCICWLMRRRKGHVYRTKKKSHHMTFPVPVSEPIVSPIVLGDNQQKYEKKYEVPVKPLSPIVSSPSARDFAFEGFEGGLRSNPVTMREGTPRGSPKRILQNKILEGLHGISGRLTPGGANTPRSRSRIGTPIGSRHGSRRGSPRGSPHIRIETSDPHAEDDMSLTFDHYQSNRNSDHDDDDRRW